MATPKFNFGPQKNGGGAGNKDAADLSKQAHADQSKANQSHEQTANAGKGQQPQQGGNAPQQGGMGFGGLPASTGPVTASTGGEARGTFVPQVNQHSQGQQSLEAQQQMQFQATGIPQNEGQADTLRNQSEKQLERNRFETPRQTDLPELKPKAVDRPEQEQGGPIQKTQEVPQAWQELKSPSVENPEVEINDPPPGNPRVSGASDVFSFTHDRGRIPGPQPIVGIGIVKTPFEMIQPGQQNPTVGQGAESIPPEDWIDSPVPFEGQRRGEGEAKFRVQVEGEPPAEVFAIDRFQAQQRYNLRLGIISTTRAYNIQPAE